MITLLSTIMMQIPDIPTDDQSVGLIGQALTAAINGDYMLLTSVSLMLLVFFLNKNVLPLLKTDEKTKLYLPVISVGLSVLMAAATMILNPTVKVASTLLGALVASTSAMGTWELLFKHLLKTKSPEVKKDPVVESVKENDKEASIEAPKEEPKI